MRTVRPEKTLVRSIALLAMTIVIGGSAVASESNVSLRWALGAWSNDQVTPDAILRDTRLDAGTRLKFLVEPTSPSTVYLIMQDSEGAISVLYRETSVMQEGAPTYIPPGAQYFELEDAVGVDTFFLIASKQPLEELDALLARYEAGDDEAKNALATEVIGEIRRQHKAHRDFSRAVEKPVLIGGQTRSAPASLNDAIDRLATDVKSDGFYSKTITIGH